MMHRHHASRARDDSRVDSARVEGGGRGAARGSDHARGAAVRARRRPPGGGALGCTAGLDLSGRPEAPDHRAARAGSRRALRSAARDLCHVKTPRAHDVGLFRKVLGGLSCREYEAAAEAVPAAFGLAKSTMSRCFIRASAQGCAGCRNAASMMPSGSCSCLMARRSRATNW